jgi:hypothetical protein
MLLTSAFAALSTGGLYVPAQGANSMAVIYSTVGLMMLAYGANSTILATIMMDKSDPATAGTDYTLQSALGSFLNFVGSGLALGFAQSIGYSGVLTAAVASGIIALVLVWFYRDFAPTPAGPVTVDTPLGDDAPVALES